MTQIQQINSEYQYVTSLF